jgi:hemerythrin-like domain-containing protein
MAWEEAMLYPEIDLRAGTPWATRVSRFDHQQMRELAAKLRAGQHELGHRTASDPQADVRCRLFALEALLRAHVEREERFLIPLLGDDRQAPNAETPASAGPDGRLRPWSE